MFCRLWLRMIMKQEEKTISLISYYALLTVSRKYFLDYAVLMINKCIQILHFLIIDITDILELRGY